MNKRKIKELIELVEQSGISELEVHLFGGRKIVIRKDLPFSDSSAMSHSTAAQPAQQTAVPVTTAAPIEAKPAAEEDAPKADDDDDDKYYKMEAPMVGTFYQKPSPDSPSYVNIGDHITVGQVVCLIEAMKLFNEVKSEVSGTIKKVMLEDASPVEFGQTILLIEPD